MYSNGAICLIKLLFKMGLFTVKAQKLMQHIAMEGAGGEPANKRARLESVILTQNAPRPPKQNIPPPPPNLRLNRSRRRCGYPASYRLHSAAEGRADTRRASRRADEAVRAPKEGTRLL